MTFLPSTLLREPEDMGRRKMPILFESRVATRRFESVGEGPDNVVQVEDVVKTIARVSSPTKFEKAGEVGHLDDQPAWPTMTTKSADEQVPISVYGHVFQIWPARSSPHGPEWLASEEVWSG